jgi:hypothetical protein
MWLGVTMTKVKRIKDQLLREETYRKEAFMLRDDKLPTLHHLNNEFAVISCEIQKAGAVMREGQRLEYQVLKVFLEERIKPDKTTP